VDACQRFCDVADVIAGGAVTEPTVEGDLAAIEAHDLYRFYRAGEDETLALRGVSVSVASSELVAVVGPSGSGKSTLLACLAGLDEPAGGTVRVGGHRMTHRSEGERARLRARHIGVLLQSGNLLEHLDVLTNVRLAQRAAGRTPQVPAADLVDSVGLKGRGRGLPRQLSGGEKARAGLAVALANSPSVLLADEPTGELDAETGQRVLQLIVARARMGTGVLVVTHSQDVMAVADRVIELRDGRVEA